MKWIKNRIQRISAWLLLVTLLSQLFVISGRAAEPQKDIDLNDRESILSWIADNIPEDLNELPQMSEQWWDSLLPNQRKVAENLAMPAYRGEAYGLSTFAFTPIDGDQVAHMKLESTGILDGYGKTLWKISNGGQNAYCLDHGASCRSAYAYGNFQKINGEVAHLIEKYGSSSTISGYFCIQMAIWALQSASTEAEAWSYAYTWYLKSYDESAAASWADTTITFFKLANGKTGSVWMAEGPAGSQRVAKYEEFVTSPYTAGGTPGEEPDGPGTELVEPEFAVTEDSVEVSYEVGVEKSDWQTGAGLKGCVVEIYENGQKVKTVTTDSKGKASYNTSKSASFSAEYCTNYDMLTPDQQAAIQCFTSLEEAMTYIETQKNNFEDVQYTYQCKEVTAPAGYVWKENKKSVNIAGNGKGTLKITNERTLGAVELIKYDTESESEIVQGDATLKGAVYGIYAAEDIVHQDKKTGILYRAGELVSTAEVGKSPKRNVSGYILNKDGSRHIEKPNGEIDYLDTPGKTIFGDLELGKYYIQEITPSEGYLLDQTKYEVTFTYKDQMIKVETREEAAKDAENSLTVDDESNSKIVYSGEFVKKQGIQFIKTSDNAYQTELKPIEGVGFSIYLISELTGVKSGEIAPVAGTWGTEDILTFYDYDFRGESKAILYKRKSEPWTKGDTKWLKSLGGNQYEVSEMFTDKNGYIETPELPYGTYVVVETTTPEYHKSAKPFIVQITEDSRILQNQRIINNTITETFLRIVKADEEFLAKPGTYIKPEEVVRGTVLKEGAQYLIKCLSKEFSKESLLALNWKIGESGYLTYYVPAEKTIVGTEEIPFTTAFLKADGKVKDSYITLPQKLPIGTYELEEITAPEGYVQNGKEQKVDDTGKDGENGYEIINSPKASLTFTIENGLVYPEGQMGKDKYVLYDQYGNLTVTILQENQEQKGIVEIYKHGEQLAAVSEKMDFIYEDAPIEGAKFQIVAVEDIYTQELDKNLLKDYAVDISDYLVHKKGAVVGTITTDKNGWGYLADLYIGRYKIVEIVAGEGFVLNKTEKEFQITPQEQTVSFEIYRTDYENQRQKLEIEVKKTDKETGDVLRGATYGLYTAQDIGTMIEKDTLVAQGTTDETGHLIFEKDLPLGSYYIVESDAPAGYLKSTIKKSVDAGYKNQLVEIQQHFITFENKSSEVLISKRDITNDEELCGATLEVYELIDGQQVLKESWISGTEPKLLKALPLEQQLVLRETIPASGYVTSEEIVFKLTQEIDENGNLLERTKVLVKYEDEWISLEDGLIVMKDDVTKLKISKKDITNQEELPGATLEIYDEAGSLISAWTSTKEPYYIEKLPIGNYRLVEKTAPTGYGYAEDVWFEISDTGEIQTVEMFDSKQKIDVEKTVNSQSVKPGQEFSYTIDIVKNCTDESLNEFTLTDQLPKYVRLKNLSTGTYNQELSYEVRYKTNLKDEWILWKDNLKTTSNYYLECPKTLEKGEYITAFRFCFGTVGGRFSQVISPEYTVSVTKDAVGVLKNQVELTATLEGEPIKDKDETDTPIEVPVTPENPKDNVPENLDDTPEFYPAPKETVPHSVKTGDQAAVGGFLAIGCIALIFLCGMKRYKSYREKH